jgi:hypothetical protein
MWTVVGVGGTRISSREGEGGRGGGEVAMIAISGPRGLKRSRLLGGRLQSFKYGLWRLTPYKSDEAVIRLRI